MTATPLPESSESHQSVSSDDSSTSLINIDSRHIQPSSPTDDFVHLPSHSPSDPLSSTSTPERKAKLIYCKSHVSIHPTAFHRDNISGYLGIVEVDSDSHIGRPPNFDIEKDNDIDEESKTPQRKDILVFWVPNELLDRMTEEEREGYKKIEGRSTGSVPSQEEEKDGFVFVTLPPPRGEKYAFSVSVSGIYSILVYPPSLTHWHGSATLNLMGGISLPTLFFHDDESPLLAPSRHSTKIPSPRTQWGFPPFLHLLELHANLLRSRLLSAGQNRGAELWLVNPSKSDREVHENGLEVNEAETLPYTQRTSSSNSTAEVPYSPMKAFPSVAVLNQTTPRQTLLTSLSSLTNLSRKTAQTILNHPLAQPVVPHLPPAVRSLVTVPGEWETASRLSPKTRRGGADVATEFEAARLYLARWARVVAEEGERSRRNELASRAGLRRGSAGEDGPSSLTGSTIDDLSSSLGVFSLLSSPNSKRPTPNPTRTPQHPITARDWESFAAQGRNELWVRREIFKRGFSDSPEPEEKATRREGWEMLLGVVPWSVGGVGGGVGGKERRRKERREKRIERRAEYERLKDAWRSRARNEADGEGEEWKEEWHRIDALPFLDTYLTSFDLLPLPRPFHSFTPIQVDCRRTDRNQPIFAVPTEAVRNGNEEKEAGGAGSGMDWEGKMEKEEEGGMASLNPHIAALRTVLMTYHTYSPELGYVQGMSDLLSPIYVVFDGDEGESFWGLVGVMKMMESNFLRDQSGMKRKLSTLQQLIGVMDPELYAHLERTDSLNLFFCFRWILIAFKREFRFDKVIKLWEVLWTNYYSNQFVLFVALAVLQSHRDVLLRYLTEFDEVLKYANDLSGTIDLDTTLAQAEVLFISFRELVEDLAKEEGDGVDGGLRRRKYGSSVEGGDGGGGKTRTDISSDLRDLLECWKLEEGGV